MGMGSAGAVREGDKCGDVNLGGVQVGVGMRMGSNVWDANTDKCVGWVLCAKHCEEYIVEELLHLCGYGNARHLGCACNTCRLCRTCLTCHTWHVCKPCALRISTLKMCR